MDTGLWSQQRTLQRFWNKIKFERSSIDFKGNKWLLWSRCLDLDKKETSRGLKKSARTRIIKTSCELPAQVNFRQLRAETAGNRYLRRFLPASASIFTCGSVYLRPSQVILHAPVLQCASWGNQNGSVEGRITVKKHKIKDLPNHCRRVRLGTLKKT